MKNKLALIVGMAVVFLSIGGTALAVQTFSDAIAVPSLRVGEEGIGGVTYFNGTIVNSTTNAGADNPVTFGDDVRIDGMIYRTEVGGANPLKIADTLRPTSDGAYDIGTSAFTFNDGYFDGTLTVDNIVANSYSGIELADLSSLLTGVISTSMLVDGSITAAKIADDAVTTAKIADDAVSEDKINGAGGANLPIAYGFVKSDGTLSAGTSNVSVSWNGVNERFEITIDGEEYYWSDYVAIVTPADSGVMPETSSVADMLLVEFEDSAGTMAQANFQFVVYKP